MKHPIEDQSLFGIDLIDELVEECLQRDNSGEGISDFPGETEAFDYLRSIIEEANYDELCTRRNTVSDSKPTKANSIQANRSRP
ncbi:hypothetical protein CR513_30746, partial [Mucuna pruriens]